jgi:hypothetical protein
LTRINGVLKTGWWFPSEWLAAIEPGPKRKGTGACGPVPSHCCRHLALSYDRRGRGRSFSLADVLRTASDAQESEHRGHS